MHRAFVEKIVTLFAVSICAYVIYATLWGPYKTTIVHHAIFLGVMLIIFFWSKSPLGKSRRLFYVDTLLIICILITQGYVVFFWEDILTAIGGTYLTTFQIVVGCGIIFTVLEAVRRVSIGLFLIALAAIAYILFGNFIPGALSHAGIGFKRFVYLTAFSFEGIFGLGLAVASTYLFMFILFGSALQQTGAADFFLKLTNAMVGQTRGAPAKCAVVASGLTGTVSGSSIANVVTTGSFTIPLMKRMGFQPHVAGAIEVLSSEGGQLMPPVMGAGAFLMAELTGIPYWSIVVAAIIPALLYYVSAFVVVDMEAAKLKMKGTKGAYSEKMWSIWGEGWHYLLVLLLLFYLLLITGLTATFCGLIATLAIIVLSQLRRKTRIGLSQIFAIFDKGARSAAEVTALIGTIGIVQQAFTVTGLGQTISDTLVTAAGGNPILLLIMAMGIALLLGMGVPTPIAYLISAIFVAPALTDVGFTQMAAHLFLFFFAIKSGSTPPIAVVAVVAAGIAQSNWWKTAWRSFLYSLPGFCIAYAFMFHPEYLMQGRWTDILLNFIFGIIGTAGIAFALQRYLLTKLKLWEAGLLGVASFTMVVTSLLPTLVALGIVFIFALLHWKRNKDQAGFGVQPVERASSLLETK
jgi:TRAP transporter 4TM/12TM fusion protein